ncbi:hypothetical protein PMAYCL1PPCAC_09999, partial [Pristionchus mayeri]
QILMAATFMLMNMARGDDNDECHADFVNCCCVVPSRHRICHVIFVLLLVLVAGYAAHHANGIELTDFQRSHHKVWCFILTVVCCIHVIIILIIGKVDTQFQSILFAITTVIYVPVMIVTLFKFGDSSVQSICRAIWYALSPPLIVITVKLIYVLGKDVTDGKNGSINVQCQDLTPSPATDYAQQQRSLAASSSSTAPAAANASRNNFKRLCIPIHEHIPYQTSAAPDRSNNPPSSQTRPHIPLHIALHEYQTVNASAIGRFDPSRSTQNRRFIPAHVRVDMPAHSAAHINHNPIFRNEMTELPPRYSSLSVSRNEPPRYSNISDCPPRYSSLNH